MPSPLASLCLLLSALLFPATEAITVDELMRTPDLTPKVFAGHFADFEFQFRAQVQSPEIFLSSRSGDCDDYSILAAQVLKSKGYTPRLIAVRMPKIVHVVCYLEETRSYLDYNLRNSRTPLVSTGGTIEEIAESVAKSYGAKWSSASEFTYEADAKRLVQTVLAPRKEKKFAAFLK